MSTTALRHLLQRFPASLVILVLLLFSMWANREYAREIKELCAAGRVLFDEGSVAWEGLDELAPGNLRRDDRQWFWARDRFQARCAALQP